MREPLLGCAVGKKGIGKTYTTTQMLKNYANGFKGRLKPRRVLILDVNDEFTEFKAIAVKDIAKFSYHPKIEIRRIRPLLPSGKKMTLRDVADVLEKVLENFKGGLLLIEDINKYISDSLPNDLIGSICTNRHTDLDIIMHYQSIGRITPKVWQNLNWIRFHKNTDSVERHKKKFEDKLEMLSIAEEMVKNKVDDGNKYFYLTIDADAMLIKGAFSKKDFHKALNEYVANNYNKLVKPMLNKRNAEGEKAYNPKEVHKLLIEKLTKEYYGNSK